MKVLGTVSLLILAAIVTFLIWAYLDSTTCVDYYGCL